MVSAIAIEKGFEDFIEGKLSFEVFAGHLFQFQAKENKIYKDYLRLINCSPEDISHINDIPFLPITFFKNHQVKSTEFTEEKVFTSSSTTGQVTSKHYLKSIDHYLKNATSIFENLYGPISQKIIIGLLPSYLERTGSSLVSMVDHFIKLSNNEASGFHLYDLEKLVHHLQNLKNDKSCDVVLFAVRFALLDLAEKYDVDFSHITIIETGGMKGKRGPVSNEELKEIVSSKLKPKTLISEYGMTELLSQAYSDDNFIFDMPKSMRVMISDLNDPFTFVQEGRSGQVNIIDLANQYSCAFIATDDMGVLVNKERFKILGRLDHSEQRGCNLLVSDVII